jgi:hypothetical protein
MQRFPLLISTLPCDVSPLSVYVIYFGGFAYFVDRLATSSIAARRFPSPVFAELLRCPCSVTRLN